jgi:single-stranded-DNA-specific exonuclease
MQEKRWVLQDTDEALAESLRRELRIHPAICRIFSQRGISNREEAVAFFRPKIDHLHDPYLMKDMDKAVDRIDRAIRDGEHVLIYGDYDVDGTTAVALVYSYLSAFCDRIDYYQPDRYKEGYGISTAGIDFAADNGISLIIALDCGIKAVEKVGYARTRGIDFIICDHHLPGTEIPEAAAVLDPKRPGCGYPYKELCGCGIGFKLVQAYADRHALPENDVFSLMDLLAVAIAADIVPITGENRVMVYYGLKLINQRPSVALSAMLRTAQFDRALTVTDLVFVIAPRINAAGRIDHASYAVDLLLEQDAGAAFDKAVKINDDNTYRRELDASITAEALEMVRGSGSAGSTRSTVLYRPDWHKGVIGIVASRVIETYYKPTIILTRSNGKVVGSARSVKGFDLYRALESCADDLDQFGGHKYAAGLTLTEEAVPAFREHFEAVVSEMITEDSLVPVIQVDAEIELSDIDEDFYNIVSQLAPFGPGNRKPVFVTRDVRDSGNSRTVKDIHLKLELYKPDQREIRGIAFKQGDRLEHIRRSTMFDICYQLQLNEWNGNKNVELNVKDMK